VSTDPRNQLFGTLPFVSAFARHQSHEVIRRAFSTDEKQRVLLHLKTQDGPIFLEMIAGAVHIESDDAFVVLTGREVELRHGSELSSTASTSASIISSVTLPSVFDDSGKSSLPFDSSKSARIISSVTLPSVVGDSGKSSLPFDSKVPAYSASVSKGNSLRQWVHGAFATQIAEDEEKERAWLANEMAMGDFEEHTTSSGDVEDNRRPSRLGIWGQ
jgi:hypothetical protein